jgi:hypothetical protein
MFESSLYGSDLMKADCGSESRRTTRTQTSTGFWVAWQGSSAELIADEPRRWRGPSRTSPAYWSVDLSDLRAVDLYFLDGLKRT